MRMTHPSRVGFVLNGAVVDALATAVEEYVAEHYVEKPTSRGGCPTCGGKWTRSDPPSEMKPVTGRTIPVYDDRTCEDVWHDQRPSKMDGCPTCGGRWTRSGPPRKPHPDDQILDVNLQPALISGRDGTVLPASANCPDEWHQRFFPQGRRVGY